MCSRPARRACRMASSRSCAPWWMSCSPLNGSPVPWRRFKRNSRPDRSELSQGKEFGVFTANTWRLADLGAKHAFLRAGLGWGGMPVEAIKRDLANRSLVKIRLEDVPEGHLVMAMAAVFRTDRPPGP